MSLSTEQMTKLGKHCGWLRPGMNAPVWYMDRADTPDMARRGYLDDAEWFLTLPGERVVIEKLMFLVDPCLSYWQIEDTKDNVIAVGDTLSQAIEGGVKAWLNTQIG